MTRKEIELAEKAIKKLPTWDDRGLVNEDKVILCKLIKEYKDNYSEEA